MFPPVNMVVEAQRRYIVRWWMEEMHCIFRLNHQQQQHCYRFVLVVGDAGKRYPWFQILFLEQEWKKARQNYISPSLAHSPLPSRFIDSSPPSLVGTHQEIFRFQTLHFECDNNLFFWKINSNYDKNDWLARTVELDGSRCGPKVLASAQKHCDKNQLFYLFLSIHWPIILAR